MFVFKRLQSALPKNSFIYLADQAFAPYGERTQSEIQARTKKIVEFLVHKGSRLIVIACNTATLNAVNFLRKTFPVLPIVGMEPAVKPATKRHKNIIVLGTNSTVRNRRYRTLINRYAAGKQVWHLGAPDLVRQVERGELDDLTALKNILSSPTQAGATAFVVGCTHFSFLTPAIQRICSGLEIFDGAEGTVAEAARQAIALNLKDHKPTNQFFTTGASKKVSFLGQAINLNALYPSQVTGIQCKQ